MWDIPKHRLRSYLNHLKRSQTTDQRRTRSLQIHIKRSDAEIRVSQGNALAYHTIAGRFILSDFKESIISLFCVDPIAVGSTVSINIQKPQTIFFRGKVAACYMVPSTSSVITDTKYQYRCLIRITFQNAAEQAAIGEYSRTMRRLLYHEV